MSEVSGPPERKRPFAGAGSALASGLAAGTGLLVQLTGKLFGEARDRARDFAARPEHSRWRAYALTCYGAIVVATLIGQRYTTNALAAYVRVQPVELPALTQIFVRNDSKDNWTHVKLTLNGIYGYETNQVQPGGHVLLPVDRFAVSEASGKMQYAPKNIVPRQLSIEATEGRYDTELQK